MAAVLGFGYVPLDVWDEGGRRTTEVGGSAANTLCMMSALGHETTLLGAVGEDDAGRRCLRQLRESGVDVSHIPRRRGRRTKTIHILVEPSGERRFHIPRGNVAAVPTWREVASAGVDPAAFDVFHTAHPTRGAIELARRSRLTSYNGQRWRTPSRASHLEMLGVADLLVLSMEYLMRIVVRDFTRPPRLSALRDLPAVVKIVTLGRHGLVALRGEQATHMAAVDLAARGLAVEETTGAGDAFHAGLLHRLLLAGKPLVDITQGELVEACRFGSQMAAWNCVRRGTKNTLPETDYPARFGDDPPRETIPSDAELPGWERARRSSWIDRLPGEGAGRSGRGRR